MTGGELPPGGARTGPDAGDVYVPDGGQAAEEDEGLLDLEIDHREGLVRCRAVVEDGWTVSAHVENSPGYRGDGVEHVDAYAERFVFDPAELRAIASKLSAAADELDAGGQEGDR